MLGRFFRRGKVWPGFFFPRGKIYTGILFPGAILSRGSFPGGSSMRGGGGNSMLQHRDYILLCIENYLREYTESTINIIQVLILSHWCQQSFKNQQHLLINFTNRLFFFIENV